LDFLRRVPLAPQPSGAGRPFRPRPRTAAEAARLHHNLKPVLRGVSGSTVSSLATALAHHDSRAATAPPASRGVGGGGTGGEGSGRVPIEESARRSFPGPSGAAAEELALRPMVCGIMGPSGAGKTSLLDCLAGRKSVGTVTGEVRLNGCALHPHELRRLTGYVLQDDVLPAMLTVRECLEFQAKLRMPEAPAMPGAAAREAALGLRVGAVLQRLKLGRQQGTVVGNAFKRGLSGGEKRRVSVAIELLSEPAVLFLDEPTTASVIV
jgi:ABC-type multidrug transport system fused ATPase/permease subunit